MIRLRNNIARFWIQTVNKNLFYGSLAVVISLGVSWGASQSFGNLRLTEVAPKIMTPNGDLRNDVVFFRFDNVISGLPIDSAIYNITGARVGTMKVHSLEQALTWDGKDSSGHTLPSGIYLYSITIGKNEATGTIVLAR